MAVTSLYRDDGTLIFDPGIPPYCCVAKGTVTTVSTTGANPHWSGNSPSSALIPMSYDSDELIALYMPGYGYARYANLQFNGVWYHIFHTMAPVGTTVTFYRFMPATTIGGDFGPGVETFTSAAQRTFHSAMRPAIVMGTLSGLGASATLPAGRTYASIVQTLAGHSRSVWDGGQESEYNDKGQLIWTYWTGYSDSKLYGVEWSASNAPSLVQVWFDDQQIKMDVLQSPSRPADTEFYHMEIENVLFVDVTGI